MTTEAPAPITPLSAEDIAAMTPADAASQLERRVTDSDFRSRWLSGSGPHVQEANALIARKLSGGDRLDQIIAGTAEVSPFEATTGGELSTYNQMQAAGWLKDLGISDTAIREAFEGKPVPREQYDWVMNLKADLESNPEFLKRYFKGEREAVRKMMLCNIVKTCGFQQAAA